ncbi:hypothetical protein CFOL_v3_01023, partial [Cephalotus follicularis]
AIDNKLYILLNIIKNKFTYYNIWQLLAGLISHTYLVFRLLAHALQILLFSSAPFITVTIKLSFKKMLGEIVQLLGGPQPAYFVELGEDGITSTVKLHLRYRHSQQFVIKKSSVVYYDILKPEDRSSYKAFGVIRDVLGFQAVDFTTTFALTYKDGYNCMCDLYEAMVVDDTELVCVNETLRSLYDDTATKVDKLAKKIQLLS